MKFIEALDKRCGVYEISAESATEIVETQAEKNRPASVNRINRYAGEMRRGKWRISGEPILFDQNGRLIDGQHRLRACAVADKPFRSIVLYGAWPFKVLGQGKARSAADVLGIEGIPNAVAMSAVARLCILHGRALSREASLFVQTQRNPVDHWKFVSNEEIETWVSKHPEAGDFYVESRKVAGGKKSLLPLSPVTAAWMLSKAVSNEEEATAWYIGLASGIGLSAGDIRLLLRRVYQGRHTLKRVTGSPIHTLADISKAWSMRNAKGQKVFIRKETEAFLFFR